MGSDLAGLLLVDKPKGPTSHDVITLVRRLTGVRRIGHTGTLDPFASGLLLVCVGWATRLSEYLTPLPKVYSGVIRLGEQTDTDDRTGTVIARSDGWRELSDERVRELLESYVGTIRQTPPAYSAKKIAGRRAYAVAREGGNLALRAENVTISKFSMREFAPPDIGFEVECSAGTYVRALARDLGDALGVGGHLATLRRLNIGRFSVDDALAVARDTHPETVMERICAPEAAVSHLTRADLGGEAVRALSQGRPVRATLDVSDGPVAVFLDGRVAAIAQWKDGTLSPSKVFSAQLER